MATQTPSSPEPRSTRSTPFQQQPYQQQQQPQQQQQQQPYALPTSPDNMDALPSDPIPQHFPSSISPQQYQQQQQQYLQQQQQQPQQPQSHQLPISSLTAMPPFQPFFTLIEDANTAAHFHPTVHYIFSDDNYDPIAAHAEALAEEEAAAAANAAESSSNSNSISGSGEAQDSNGVVMDGIVDGGGGGNGGRAGAGGAGGNSNKKKQRERIVVVDFASDGETVLNARSLSRDWQVVGVNITNAPTWMAEDGGPGTTTERSPSAASGASGQATSGTAGSGGGGGGGTLVTGASGTGAGGDRPPRGLGEAGLMLSIEGMGQLEKVKKMESLDELAMIFNERMDSLRRVINFAEKAPPLQDN